MNNHLKVFRIKNTFGRKRLNNLNEQGQNKLARELLEGSVVHLHMDDGEYYLVSVVNDKHNFLEEVSGAKEEEIKDFIKCEVL